MSSDNTLFRARLTGVVSEDATDTAPVGERVALVQYVSEDTDASAGPGEQKGTAKVILPNGVDCPLYAAQLHLFGTLDSPLANPPGPDLTELPNARQPRVIIRRDLTTPGTPATVCQSLVIHPTFTVLIDVKWATATETIAAGEFADVKFFDGQGNVATTKLAYYPTEVLMPPKIGHGTLGVVTMRLKVPNVPTLPVTSPAHVAAWLITGVGMIDHNHLRVGAGRNGGGPAFAAFSPATVAEALAAGYVIP